MSRKSEVSIVVRAKDAARNILSRTRAGLMKLKSAVFSLQGALGGLTLALTASSLLQAGSAAEQYRLRLEALLGSQAEANQMFKDAAGFASRVPHEYEQIMDAATALSGVLKGGREEVMELLPIISDLAAVSGLSMKETTSNFIRMWSAGASAADMFRERGILAMLGFQAGAQYSAEETRKVVIAAYEDINSKFRGAADKLGTSWKGMLSMVSDRWFQFRNMVNDAGLFQGAKDALEGFLRKLDELAADGTLQEWAEGVSHFSIRAVRFVGRVLKAFGDGVKFLKEHPLLAAGGVLGLWFYGPAGAAVLAGIGEVIDQIIHVMVGPVSVSEHLSAQIQDVGKQLQELDKERRKIRDRIERRGTGYRKYEEDASRLREIIEEAQRLRNTLWALNDARNSTNSLVEDEKSLWDELVEELINFGVTAEEAAEAKKGLLDIPPPPPRPEMAGPEAVTDDWIPEDVDVPTFWEDVGRQIKEITGDAYTLSHVMGTILVDSIQGFGDAVTDAFESAIAGEKAFGRAFVSGMLGALGAVAKGFGDFFLQKSIAAVGEALLMGPAGGPMWAAAAKYALAATGMYALAGTAGAGASAAASGGHSGAAQATYESNQLSDTGRGEALLVIEGGLLDMSDPRQQDALANALSTLSGLRVTVVGG